MTVHPRAGGEHSVEGMTSTLSGGSSPRGRGTRARAHGRNASGRFIPARAGNTWCGRSNAAGSSVHPRAGGEHDKTQATIDVAFGSSPRGRGTRSPAARDRQVRRFIPARAGNTATSAPPATAPTVHPRAGGEHPPFEGAPSVQDGSSPRGRGTRSSPRRARVQRRFIPARAGNTSRHPHRRGDRPVHPRAGGEHPAVERAHAVTAGSSPRGRGTPAPDTGGRDVGRFIPARAGNTRGAAAGAAPPTVHPRAGGEHVPSKLRYVRFPGSSPRGRGTRPHPGGHPGANRFIPARAGNTVETD